MTGSLMRRGWAAWLAAVLTLLLASHAWGQGVSKAAAEALFNQGKELFDAEKYEEACQKFQASQDLDPAVGTLLYLGDCNEKRGKVATAWGAFQQAISLAEQLDDKRLEIAKVRATALEPRVSQIKVNVPIPVDGLVVRQDGEELPASTFGTALPADAGLYNIEATAPGYEPFEKEFIVEDGGKTVSLDIPKLKKRGADTPLPTPEPGGSGGEDAAGVDPLLVGGIVVGGLGVAGIAIGAVFGAMADSTNEESLAQCRADDPSICLQEGVDLREDAQTQARTATALFVVGGVALAAGTALVIVSLVGDDEEEGDSAMLTPWAGPQGGGLLLRGNW